MVKNKAWENRDCKGKGASRKRHPFVSEKLALECKLTGSKVHFGAASICVEKWLQKTEAVTMKT